MRLLLGMSVLLGIGCGDKASEATDCEPTCTDGLTCMQQLCVPDQTAIDAGVPDAEPPDAAPPALDPSALEQQIGDAIEDLDVLLVIDSSGSMREEQAELARSFGSLTNALEQSLGGLPNLHLGVISADLGAGDYGIMGCSGAGDAGVLQTSGCALQDTFIVDTANADGIGRSTNYTGTLADNVSCLTQLGVTGCGFEQTLESMRRALDGSNPQNEGFLRPDAMLAVLLLSDEDDCSASDTAIYDSAPELDTLDGPLGPLSSFRCFEFGVVCDLDNPRESGDKENCVPRANSEYLYEVSEYAAFLNGLKTVGGRVFFAPIVGTGAIVVGERNGEPDLSPACVSAVGEADSGVRITALAEQMGMPVNTICEDFAPALTNIAGHLTAMMSGRCLAREAANGQSCRIVDVSGFGSSEERVVQELPSCASTSAGACSTQTAASANCPQGSGIEVQIDRRGTTVPPDTVVVASCPQ